MSRNIRRYNPQDPRDAEILHQMLLESDSDDNRPEFEEESDTDREDNVEQRDEESDTVQEASSDEGSSNSEEDEIYFVGRDQTTKWKKTKFTQRVKERPQNILVRLPGTIGDAKHAKTILDCWNCFINIEILENIVRYTNQYIEVIKIKFLRERDAKYTDLIEIKAFIGLLYLAGVLHSNRMSLEELWGCDGFGVEMFRLVMSLKRFKLLLRCIRFDDRTTRQQRRNEDKVAPIRDIFTMFVNNCKNSYSPGPNVTIDEMLVGFRGRCSFRQYIPSKPNKYGIKIFSLVDAKTWYSFNLEIYPGKQPEGQFQQSNSPSDVVKRLAQPIYNSGRNITADNWFTSVELVDFLQAKKVSYVGTMKKNKRALPPEFVITRARNEKTSLFGFQKNSTIVSYVPKKYKNVLLISSMHFDDSIDEETGDDRKPNIITFYNKTKSGVDLVDKMCAFYNVQRNTRRWPLVVFFTMLNVSGINAHVVHKANDNDSQKRKMFLKQLSKELVAEQLNRRSTKKRGIPLNLQNKIQEINPTGEVGRDELQGSTSAKRKRCAICIQNKKQRYSKYYCKVCNKCLCLEHVTIICETCYHAKINENEAVEEENSE